MSFVAKLQRAREVLEQQGRLSVRALSRELALGNEELEELIEELVDVQRVALREGNVLVCLPASVGSGQTPFGSSTRPPPRAADDLTANPRLLAPTLRSISLTRSSWPAPPSKASASRSPCCSLM